MATQNPVEQEGTYTLPEAQVDRFMLKVVIDYPKREDEQLIIRQNLASTTHKISAVLNTKDLFNAQESVNEVYLDEKIEQ
jgi:MoxR-like ATPase